MNAIALAVLLVTEFYFDHLGLSGQGIGMYTNAIDCWVTERAIAVEFDYPYLPKFYLVFDELV
jgi:hypothetical protein